MVAEIAPQTRSLSFARSPEIARARSIAALQIPLSLFTAMYGEGLIQYVALAVLCLIAATVVLTALAVRPTGSLPRAAPRLAPPKRVAETPEKPLRDFLTGTLTPDGLRAALTTGEPRAGVLMAFDVTGLGEINRRSGADAGDAILCEVAARLTRALRPGDLLARWGGDEFVTFLAGINRCEGEVIAGRLARALSGHFGSESIAVTAGLTAFSGCAGQALATAVREAEEEIHTIKQSRISHQLVA